MKKVFLWAIMILFIFTMVIMGTSCKKAAPTAEVTTTVVAETTEGEATTTTAAETTTAAGPIKISLWTWQSGPSYKALYDWVQKTYEASHPNVTIEWQSFGTADYNEALKTAIAGGNAPDIHGVHPGPDTEQMVSAGQLLDLTSIIKDDPEWSNWIAPALKYPDLYIDGKIYNDPQSVNHLSVFYYKDKFPNGFPETMDQMVTESERLNKEGIIPMTVGWGETWDLVDTFVVYQYQLDTTQKMLSQANSGEISWVNDTFKQAFQVIKDTYLDKGIVPKDAVALSYGTQSFEQFISKKAAAMFPMGEWYLASLPKEDLENGNIMSAPLPKLDSGKDFIVTGGSAANLCINANGKNIKTALEILKLTNSPEAQLILFDNLSTPPGVIDKQSSIPVFTEIVNRQATFPISYRYIDNPAINEAVGTNLQKLLLGTSVDECLANIQKVAEQEHNK